MSELFYRLPRNAWPLVYQIELSLDVQEPTFQGFVQIKMRLENASKDVVLHGQDIDIKDAVFVFENGQEIPASAEAFLKSQTMRFFVQSGMLLPAGELWLKIRYQAPISPGLQGLYRSQDMSERALCTQCQPTDARRIFPCFDEPEFKASLQWTLRTPKGVLALTNGSLLRLDEKTDQCTWHFAPTRRVSSYLAALVVGEFESAPPTVVKDVPLSVYAWKGKVAQTHFATELTAQLLPYYEGYFGQRYPYGKYDQVAVPGFDAGAMENIGLVLFRQNALLLNPKTASWRQEKRVAIVVAHEFAHMWFGNWVTMRWWDDLWLNEAFAEWMCHKALDAIRPDYQIWDDFQEARHHVLADDAMPTTHPIWTPVETPAQATELFDSITYEKGCAVMRMLEQFLGADLFQKGLQSYMQEFAESNASGADLWRKLAEASGQDVPALMHSWISQAGFPLVSVEETDQMGTLRCTQKRFFASVLDQGMVDDTLWHIPLRIRYEDADGQKEHRCVITKEQDVISLPVIKELKWCYANAGDVGFYRTQLSSGLLDKLIAHLDALSPVEQVGVIEDQWALIRSGKGDLPPFLKLLERMAKTSSHQVMSAVKDRLYALEGILQEGAFPSVLVAFRAWIGGILSKEEVPTEMNSGSDPARMEFHASRLSILARLAQHPDWVQKAQQMEQMERQDAGCIEPNLVGTAIAVAAYFGAEDLQEAFVQTYLQKKKQGAAPQEALRYLYAWSLFRSPAQVQRALDLIDQEMVPQDNIRFVLGQMLSLQHSRDAAWQYFTAHWPDLQKKVGDLGISRLIESVGGLPFSRRKEVVDFFTKHPPEKAERALARALKHMDQHHELCQRLIHPLTHFLVR